MKLSREQMLDVINNGGSVFLSVNGVHRQFTPDNIDELPSVTDLALGDKQAEAAARKELDEKLAELLAEKAKLDAVEEAKTKETDTKKKAEK